MALLDSRDVLIQDQLSGLQPGSHVRWGMITPGIPGAAGAASIDLRQKDARLMMTIVSPPSASWKIINTAKPRNEWDSPNQNTCMIAFEAIASNSGELTLAVMARPGADMPAKAMEIVPLEKWGR